MRALAEHARRIGWGVMQVVFLKEAFAQGGERVLAGGLGAWSIERAKVVLLA